MDKDAAATLFREMMDALGPDAVADMVASQAQKAQPKLTTETRVMPSEPIRIFALEDITGPDGKIVHERGYMQAVPPVDAREITRSGRYGYAPPSPLRPTPAVQAVPATSTTDSGVVGATIPSPFALTEVPGINDKVARSLEDAGFGTADAVRGATIESLAAVQGMGNKLAERLIAHVAENYPASNKEA